MKLLLEPKRGAIWSNFLKVWRWDTGRVGNWVRGL